jgi:hypothetical protein
MAVWFLVRWIRGIRKEKAAQRERLAKKRVFVSYRHRKDLRYKKWLAAWEHLDVRSPAVPVNSENARPIRAALTKKMREADYLLVIIGKDTHKSDWIAWEIQKAKEEYLKLVAVKINNRYKSPPALLNSKAAFARRFDEDEILKALENATNYY